MRLSSVLLGIWQFLSPPVVILTLLLYLYPAVQLCQFPDARPSVAACYVNGTPAVQAEKAPFRLLTFADPQLEGDTSLPQERGLQLFQAERWRHEGLGRFKSLFTVDIPREAHRYRKIIDLWGNDLYLAHIYRLMHWWTDPTHTVVLGDLLGSQWISDEEFDSRTRRFWKVFKGATKVPAAITDSSGRREILGEDTAWKRRLISLAGNHDIGYSGDIDEHRLRRFEDAFGRVNWDVTFVLNDSTRVESPFYQVPELRVIILNSMNLDTPALKHEHYQESLDFITGQMHHPTRQPTQNTGTVLLTHIPFHKEEGICTDGPFFSYDTSGRIKEQNHLSREMSNYILDGLARPDRPGATIVLNGHDHEGCDTLHHASADPAARGNTQDTWKATKYEAAKREASLAGVREITVRSMMGSYWGNTGMLSGWFDPDAEEWRFEYDQCSVGIQHIWWAVHIFALVWLSLGVGGLVAFLREGEIPPTRPLRAGMSPPVGKSKSV